MNFWCDSCWSLVFVLKFKDLDSGFLGFDSTIFFLCGTRRGGSGLCLDFSVENVNFEFIF